MEESDSLAKSPIGADLESLLECPVCYELILPPVYPCSVGHNICNHCRIQLQTCPLCRSEFSSQRNLFLERVLQRCKVSCKYNTVGCKILAAGERLFEHEKMCEYRPIHCYHCNQLIKYNEFTLHMNPNDVCIPKIEGEALMVSFKINKCSIVDGIQIWDGPWIRTYGKDFFLRFEGNGAKWWIFIAVLGTKKQSDQYFSEIILKHPNKIAALSYTGQVNSIHFNGQQAENNSRTLTISKETLQQFTDPKTNELKIDVSILLVKELGFECPLDENEVSSSSTNEDDEDAFNSVVDENHNNLNEIEQFGSPQIFHTENEEIQTPCSSWNSFEGSDNNSELLKNKEKCIGSKLCSDALFDDDIIKDFPIGKLVRLYALVTIPRGYELANGTLVHIKHKSNETNPHLHKGNIFSSTFNEEISSMNIHGNNLWNLTEDMVETDEERHELIGNSSIDEIYGNNEHLNEENEKSFNCGSYSQLKGPFTNPAQAKNILKEPQIELFNIFAVPEIVKLPSGWITDETPPKTNPFPWIKINEDNQYENQFQKCSSQRYPSFLSNIHQEWGSNEGRGASGEGESISIQRRRMTLAEWMRKYGNM